MKLIPQTSPYIRKNVSVKRMMLDVIIALLPVTIFAMVQNGWNGIYVFITSIVAMLTVELCCHMIIKWPKELKFKELFTKEGFKKVKATYTVNNITAPLISALIYALIMPAGTSFYVVLIGAILGMLIGKMLFGGLGSNIFNPAAVGRIIVSICFSLSYDNGGVDVVAGATPLGHTNGNLSAMHYDMLDMFIGNIPGCMGEVSAALILLGGVYLFARRSADLRSCLSYLLSFAVVMIVACISFNVEYDSGNIFDMWLYQMLAGGLLFGAVFMITDPVTSPTTGYGRIVFGTIAGCITALIRVCGALPEGVAFSILIANMLAPCIDHFMRGRPRGYSWKQILGLVLGVALICVVVSASVMGGWF
ncbi:MAG: RnfABCDGE type electron transport complex subunit D [Acholeplasmatales bacterium]|nr:RnfABCDGE type electron transport complex subunit D [Acholeplasmatales bacterium]